MAAVLGPSFWCHQCNRQTRPIAREDVLCAYCNGGFVEEMERTEIETGMRLSSLPLHFASLFGLPASGLSGLGSRASSGAVDGEGLQEQLHERRVIPGHRPEVSQLQGAMTDVVRQFPYQPTNTESEGRPQAPEPNTGRIGIPGSRVLIMQGEMPNFFGGLGNFEVFVDNGIGARPQVLPGHFGDYFLGSEFDRLIQFLAENDPNRYGTPPASKAAVEAMPTVKITEEHIRTEIMQCAVCKDDFELGTEVRQMSCNHMYHADCILPWLSQHNTCPVCRFEMPVDDSDDSSIRSQAASELSSEGVGRNETDESSITARRESGDSGTGMTQGRNGQGRVTRQFTFLDVPGFGMDLNSIFEEGRSDPSPSTEGVQRVSSMSGQQTSEEDSGAGSTGRRLPIPIPWLFRLFSSVGASTVEANTGNEVERLSNGSSTPAASTNERIPETNIDFSGISQEDLD